VNTREVAAGDRTFTLRAESPRTSLSEGDTTLWGFNVEVLDGGHPICIKTCFVGRVSVQARAPEALKGTAADIAVVVHGFAFDKVVESLAKGDYEDGIVFA